MECKHCGHKIKEGGYVYKNRARTIWECPNCIKWNDVEMQNAGEQSALDELLLRLLKEMKTETNEYLKDYIDDLGNLEEQTCEFVLSRLEDFFNRKIQDIERKQ